MDELSNMTVSDIDACIARLMQLKQEAVRRNGQGGAIAPTKHSPAYAEFVAQHGGTPIYPVDAHENTGTVELLPDGARIIKDGFGGMNFIDPAPGLTGLQSSRQYHELFLSIAETDFRHLKSALLGERQDGFRWPQDDYGNPGRYGPPHRDGVSALHHLHSIVLRLRETLADIDRKIEELPEVQMQRQEQADTERQRQEFDAARRMQQEAEREEIESIVV